jgi:hypothetical protein
MVADATFAGCSASSSWSVPGWWDLGVSTVTGRSGVSVVAAGTSFAAMDPPIMVGGGGEKKALVGARYADACDLFGTSALLGPGSPGYGEAVW